MGLRHPIFLLIILVFSLFSIGCGSEKLTDTTGSTEEASRISPSDTNAKVAQCNRFNSSVIDANMQSLFQNGVASFEFFYLKLNSVDNFSSGNKHLRFFLWEAVNNQDTSIASEPLEFRIETKAYGQALKVSGYINTLSYTELQKLISEHNNNNPYSKITGSTPDEWFKQIHLIISGVSRYDDAIKIALYNGNGSPIHQADALIPAFYSNPNTYSELLDPDGQERSAILKQLHPFNNQKDMWSDQRFFDAAQEYCFPVRK